jgi:CRP-like cAMP-binding protein/di/tricarboxylate transporter
MDAAAALSRCPLFSLLDRIQLARLAGELDEITLAAEEVLFRKGDPGDAFYVVRSGQAEVYTGERPLGAAPILVGPGQVIGEMAILTGEARSASIRAFSPLALWRMSGEHFLDVVAKERKIALSIERALSRRLATTLADATERQRDVQALGLLVLKLLGAPARQLLVRLSQRARWPAAAIATLRDNAGDAAALDELLAFATLLRREGEDLAVLPPLVSAFREQATADDRLWLHALGQRLAASPHAAEAVAILLLAGDASGAAAVMANHGETLREKVSLAIRNEWLAALEAAGIDATLIALARDRLAFAGGLPEPHPAPVVTTLEMDFGDTERAWRRLGAVQPIAIILSLALLAAAWLAPVPEGLGRPAFAALLTTAASLPLMLAEVLPSYVVTIMLAAGLVMPGIVAPSVALSGFASNSWLMIVVLFSVSSAIAKSGLMYRLALLMLQRLPGNLIVQSASLLGLSMVLATGVASGNARVALAAPAVRDLAEAMGLARHSRGAAFLGLVTFQAFATMGSLFVTGSSTCLLLYGMLPEPFRGQVTWTGWFGASLIPHLLLFLLFVPTLLLMYRPPIHNPIDRTRIGIQLALLGKLTRHEVMSIAALLMLGIGFSTRPYHGVADVWTAFAACLMLFIARTLDDKSFQSGINWGMMIYYGVLMSLGTVLASVKVDTWLTDMVDGVLETTLANPYGFVFTVATLAAALRFVVPWTTLCSLLALATMPLAISVGYHPLVPVLVLLIASDHTFFPFINESYFTMYHASEGYMFGHKQVRYALWAESAIRIVVLTASVPLWRMIGLM